MSKIGFRAGFVQRLEFLCCEESGENMDSEKVRILCFFLSDLIGQ
jgi:hypothetical protein